MFEPTVQGDTRALMRGIDRLTNARPGPMSWGPDDGHIRFYAPDGRVLFQANSGGASIESRGALTGMTPLLDGIRDLDDAQDGRLSGHDSTLTSHNTRITSAQSRADSAYSVADYAVTPGEMGSALFSRDARLDGHDSTLSSHGTRLGATESKNAAQDSTLSSHDGRIGTAQARADKGVSDAAAAQGTANTGVSNAATAQSRANSAYNLADYAATPGEVASAIAVAVSGLADSGDVSDLFDVLAGRITALTARVKALEDWKATLPDA